MATIATIAVEVDAAPVLNTGNQVLLMLRTLTREDKTWRTRIATKLFKFARFIVRIACKFDGNQVEHEQIEINL